MPVDTPVSAGTGTLLPIHAQGSVIFVVAEGAGRVAEGTLFVEESVAN